MPAQLMPGATGVLVLADGTVLQGIGVGANWRADRGAAGDFDQWMRRRGMVGLAGVDTRSLTKIIREKGMPHAVIAHSPDGVFDLNALIAEARSWTGLVGLD